MAPHKAKPRTIFSEDILDDLAVSSPLRFVPAGLKLCVCVSAIILAVASPELWLPLFVSLGMAGAALIFARVPLKLYLSLLTIPLTFGLTGAVIILLLTGGGDPLIRFFSFGMYTVQITTASVHLALLVLARTLAGMCSLYFLAVTTPMISLFGVFSRLHFPQEFIDLAMLIYRYIFVFIGEAIGIHNAQVMRGGYGRWRDWIPAFSMLASMLFVRTWEKGEAIFLSMNARCYDGCMVLPEDEGHVSVKAALVSVSFIGLLIIILILEILL